LIRELPALLVQEVFATIRNLGVDSADAFRRLFCPLRHGERRLALAVEPRHLVVAPVRQRGKRLKTEVYANLVWGALLATRISTLTLMYQWPLASWLKLPDLP
jgi:hypothetical protein